MILYIVPLIYPCTTGGMELFYHNLVKEIGCRHKVGCLTACSRFNDTNVEAIMLQTKFLKLPGYKRFGILLDTFVKIWRHRKDIDIIHVPYTSNAGKWGFVFVPVKKLLGIDYVIHIHGGGMKKWNLLNGDRILFKYAIKIVAVSDQTKQEYENRSKRRINKILPLVKFTKSELDQVEIKKQLGIDHDAKVILFVGSLKELKQPLVLLNSFMALGKDYIESNKLKLIFVGDGTLKEEMKRLSEENAFSDHIIFTGLIENNKVKLYYSIATLYVISSDYEGTPKSLLEAMYNELPIIGSDVNGINAIIKDEKNGLLFQPRDINSLKNKIIRLVEDETLRIEISQNALRTYESDFNYNEMLDNLLKTYSL